MRTWCRQRTLPRTSAETSAIGTSSELSRDDHVHDLPTDQTLGFRPTGELFVEVTDVLESLHETVSYYSLDDTAGYDGGGYACQGEEYDLSPLPEDHPQGSDLGGRGRSKRRRILAGRCVRNGLERRD